MRLRTQVTSFISEIDDSKKHVDKLKIKNAKLNFKILDLTTCLEKFTKGEKNLNLLLGSQICVYNRAGIGYNPLVKQKLYKNIFVKEICPAIHKISCTFCNTEGHTEV